MAKKSAKAILKELLASEHASIEVGIETAERRRVERDSQAAYREALAALDSPDLRYNGTCEQIADHVATVGDHLKSCGMAARLRKVTAEKIHAVESAGIDELFPLEYYRLAVEILRLAVDGKPLVELVPPNIGNARQRFCDCFVDTVRHLWRPEVKPKPVWDGNRLAYGGKSCVVGRQASQIRALLDELQKAGWPHAIAVPKSDNDRAVNQSCRQLSDKLKSAGIPINFIGSRATKTAEWRYAEE